MTTGIWTVDGDVQRRLDLVAGWTGDRRPDYASINMNEPGIEDLADLLTSLGIGIEAGVWTAGDARVLAASGFSDRILWVLMEPEDRDPAGAVATAAAAAAELASLGVTARQVRHGYDLATWDVLRAAVADGQDIRIGLEDTSVLPDGSRAAGNGELVAAAARLACANPDISGAPAAGNGSCWLHSAGGGMVCLAGDAEPPATISAPSSRGLGRRPLKAVTPVRIRSGLLET